MLSPGIHQRHIKKWNNKKIQKYVNERVTTATAIPKIYSIISKYKIKSNIFLQFAESLENFII